MITGVNRLKGPFTLSESENEKDERAIRQDVATENFFALVRCECAIRVGAEKLVFQDILTETCYKRKSKRLNKKQIGRQEMLTVELQPPASHHL